MSIFPQYPLAKEDPIFGLVEKFLSDSREKKVDLTIGVLRNEKLQAYLLRSVEIAEERILQKKLAKIYLPILGSTQYIEAMKQCVFGNRILSEIQDFLFGIQTIGGTGALYVACKLLYASGVQTVLVSQPTWPNHSKIASALGYAVEFFPYYNAQENRVDFSSMISHLMQSKSGSILILQASCHNPTGSDLSQEQWQILANVVKEKKFMVIFDMAYQGLGISLEEDAYPIRLFADLCIECIVATSCAKNFALYGERVGCLLFFIRDTVKRQAITSIAKSVIREIYSNPPRHGADIVTEILTSPDLRQIWEGEVQSMQDRIHTTRKTFSLSFAEHTGSDRFSFICNQYGLFSCLGCSPNDAARLQREYGIYITLDGRINLTGLNVENIPYVVESIVKVLG